MVRRIYGRIERKCPYCNGRGIVGQQEVEQPVEVIKFDFEHGGMTKTTEVRKFIATIKCPYCHGTGILVEDELIGDDMNVDNRNGAENSGGVKQ